MNSLVQSLISFQQNTNKMSPSRYKKKKKQDVINKRDNT